MKPPKVSIILPAKNSARTIGKCLFNILNQSLKPVEFVIYKKLTVIVPNSEWIRTAGVEDTKYLAEKVNAPLVSEVTPENMLNVVERAKNVPPPIFVDGALCLADFISKISR